jgi:hypothetical protein
MRILAVLLLAVVLVSGCMQSASVKVVKQTENQDGIRTADLPRVIEKNLGFKIESVKWIEDVKDGFTRVYLKVVARKERKSPLYISYNWNPEFEWSIEKSTGTIIPVNTLAKKWMEGKI